MQPLPPPSITLTIAGSDSSGGAGIQADLKTFAAHRCYGASVVTALTAQNTVGVTGIHAPPPAFVRAQLDAVTDDLEVAAAKTGMLVDAAIINAVVDGLQAAWRRRRFALVVDPVLIAKSGHALLADDAVDTMLARLIPMATLVTPNLPEAARLVGFDVVSHDDAVRAGRALLARGAGAALIKGGHGDGVDVVDVLVLADGVVDVRSQRLTTRHTHGTGCTLSAAICARLAIGAGLIDAVDGAVAYVHQAIARAPGFGAGHGPLHHLHPFDDITPHVGMTTT
jgi:hydroxymethylpyrimidine/phosphomethylpyrimidine kinase